MFSNREIVFSFLASCLRRSSSLECWRCLLGTLARKCRSSRTFSCRPLTSCFISVNEVLLTREIVGISFDFKHRFGNGRLQLRVKLHLQCGLSQRKLNCECVPKDWVFICFGQILINWALLYNYSNYRPLFKLLTTSQTTARPPPSKSREFEKDKL